MCLYSAESIKFFHFPLSIGTFFRNHLLFSKLQLAEFTIHLHALCCDFTVRIRLIHTANGNEVKKVQTSATACAASRPVMPQSHDMRKTAGRKYKPWRHIESNVACQVYPMFWNSMLVAVHIPISGKAMHCQRKA